MQPERLAIVWVLLVVLGLLLGLVVVVLAFGVVRHLRRQRSRRGRSKPEDSPGTTDADEPAEWRRPPGGGGGDAGGDDD